MQSILLHIQDDDDLDGRIDAAVILAHAFDGYISCLHTTPYGVYLTNDPFTAMMLPVDFFVKDGAARSGSAVEGRGAPAKFNCRVGMDPRR
ncbi:hypothetical protein [Sphingomonas sp. Ant20]|uniref:hypothetical protein n=1 Tax=Sphingomonas sp. Ant20 TaxID=104605 RepID=UPI0012FF064D|nr:hypothetical protein [Sphingomonas sp. Ant20]